MHVCDPYVLFSVRYGRGVDESRAEVAINGADYQRLYFENDRLLFTRCSSSSDHPLLSIRDACAVARKHSIHRATAHSSHAAHRRARYRPRLHPPHFDRPPLWRRPVRTPHARVPRRFLRRPNVSAAVEARWRWGGVVAARALGRGWRQRLWQVRNGHSNITMQLDSTGC